jgi:hypothetical protein
MKSLGRNRVAFFVSTVVSDDGSGTKEAGFLAFFEESQLNGLEEAIREYRVKYLS